MDGLTEVTIQLEHGGPWGFRLKGGADYACPLQVAKVSYILYHIERNVCKIILIMAALVSLTIF